MIENLLSVHVQPRSSDLATLHACPPHSSPYSFPDQIRLQFGNGRYQSQEKSSIIPLVSTCSRREMKTTPRLSSSSITCKKCLTLRATRSNPVSQHCRELLPAGIRHERIQSRTPCLAPRDAAVVIFLYDFDAALHSKLAQIVKLRLDALVGGANPDVDCGSQWVPPKKWAGKASILSHWTYYKSRGDKSQLCSVHGRQECYNCDNGLEDDAGCGVRCVRAQVDTRERGPP